MAIPAVLALVGAGCGGINASQSVSPASFFLPGLLQVTPPPALEGTNLVASVQ